MEVGHRGAHAHVAEVDVLPGGFPGRAGEQVVFIGEADPISGCLPDMHMGATAQGAGSEWPGEIARVQVAGRPRVRSGDDHSLAVTRVVLPVRRGMLRAEDEHHLKIMGVKGGHTAACAVARAVHDPRLARAPMHHLDPVAVEFVARRVGTRIIHNPLAVRGPHAGVGENFASRPAGHLPDVPATCQRVIHHRGLTASQHPNQAAERQSKVWFPAHLVEPVDGGTSSNAPVQPVWGIMTSSADFTSRV